jgi:hypothetical protein
MKDHFKFQIFDAKQLMIAFTGAFSAWAATGFQHDLPHVGYILVGFITGGLVSHNSESSPNTVPESHIQTPYLSNLDDGGKTEPVKTTQTDIKKLVKINSNLIQ